MLEVLRIPLARRTDTLWQSRVVEEKPITIIERWYGKEDVTFTVKGDQLELFIRKIQIKKRK